MLIITVRKYKENNTKNINEQILYLFRLLAIKYRIEHPIQEGSS